MPQGSILGRLLYLLYTVDILKQEDILLRTFADDTAIITQHNDSASATEKLQNVVNAMIVDDLKNYYGLLIPPNTNSGTYGSLINLGQSKTTRSLVILQSNFPSRRDYPLKPQYWLHSPHIYPFLGLSSLPSCMYCQDDHLSENTKTKI